MNKSYWQNFYKENGIKEPTAFAKWCNKRIPTRSKILELGSGNGRDSYFFAKQGHNVYGIDYATKPKDCQSAQFTRKNIKKFLKNKKCHYDITYSRFLLHAVSKKTLNRIINLSSGLLMAEARSIHDNSFVANHKRNLINGNKILKLLIKNDFQILYFKEGKDMAKYENQNPTIIRIIANKQKT